jgi:hypothetical protein
MLNNYVVKEYYDLNGHYLKVSLFNGDIHMVSYNSHLLNGIKYETKITSGEILNKVKSQNFTSLNLYELILKKIDEGKYIINSDQSLVSILLLETSNIFDQAKDIKIIIPKNIKHITTEYEKVLSKEVMNLREENKRLWNEIIQLKNILKINNGTNLYNSVKNKQVDQLSKSSIVLQTQGQLQESKNQKNNNMNMPNNSLRQMKSNPIVQPKGDINNITSNQDFDIKTLSNLNYPNYPIVMVIQKPFSNIIGFGANSYQGIVRDHNEDRVKIILDHKLNKSISEYGNIISPNISYFAIYDGHGGNKCCNFLQENLHNYIFESEFFPLNPPSAINQAYEKAELNFKIISLDEQNKKLIDKSGSCALSALIIDEWCYISYLGDSRGLYSYDSGNQLYQVTRDHKPDDIKERLRIEKVGGRIFKDTRLKVNGLKIKVNEKDAPGIKFPYRVSPGNLAVSLLSF